MNNIYPYFLIIHLFGAIMFVGTVFFEVLILEGVRKKTSASFMSALEKALANRIVRVIPWALLMIYGGGIGMALNRYLPMLSDPLASTFGILLTLKIVLAISVFGHFCTAMVVRKRHKGTAKFYKWLHVSVFTHVVLIVLLAKLMFYVA